MPRLHIGTSGYQYRHWRGVLYPQKLPQRRWFERYQAFFDTVELNTTFYRLPRPDSVDRWREAAPRGFVFAVKGSRYLTHMKLLLDRGPGIEKFFDLAMRLGRKLGPVLWQLPPRLEPDHDRLDGFLSALPKGIPHVVEFRHPDWYTRRTCDLLDRHGAAFCEHDNVEARPPRHTGGFRYVRFHGTTGRYSGRYGTEGLAPWARDLRRWTREADAYVYFNNDLGGHAVWDALELKRLVGEEVAALHPEGAAAP